MKRKWVLLVRKPYESYLEIIDYRYTLFGVCCSILFLSLFVDYEEISIRRY